MTGPAASATGAPDASSPARKGGARKDVTGVDAAALGAAVEAVLAPTRPLALHEPVFAGQEWVYVKDCLDTGWVSSAGSYVDRFERDIAATCGTSHAVATVNGTAALHIALQLVGVEPGDEVLLPSLTFVATANAVAYCGAIPHFVDSDRQRLGVDPQAMAEYLEHRTTRDPAGECRNRRTGRRIAALVPVHVFGHPTDMETLTVVAAHWGLPIVEDAAEALGSLYRGRPAGSLSRVAALSFNGNKIVTCGGGGAIVTQDEALAARARHLTTTARTAHRWRHEHDAIGYNYRLPNLNAALGCAQLEQLPVFLAHKRRLAAAYRDRLNALAGVEFVDEPEDSRSNFWLNAVRLPDRASVEAVLETLQAKGLLARPAWGLMHRQPMYQDCPRAPLPIAETLQDRLVCLPSGVAAAGLNTKETAETSPALPPFSASVPEGGA